jgi:ligand-binding SRPBCC domain-containing protein
VRISYALNVSRTSQYYFFSLIKRRRRLTKSMQKKNLKKILSVKSITKKLSTHHNKLFIEIECESPVESPRDVNEFTKLAGDNILVDNVKYKIEGIGYTIPKIAVGEKIKLFLEHKKGRKVNVKDKKHKSKS